LKLELRIGEIVVDGVPADRSGLGDAVERELRRLAVERGLPRRLLQDGTAPRHDAGGAAPRIDAGGTAPRLDAGGTVPRIDAGGIAASGDRLAPELARAIWEALER
jgi:hypothetical protein